MSHADRDVRDAVDALVDRADTIDLSRVVSRLAPEALHQVIEQRGLADCSELLAHATPEQLSGVFDLDLWRVHEAGAEEHFDAARFGEWLVTLVEASPVAAADKLAAIDAALVTAGLAHHIAVFDPAARSSAPEGLFCEVGGYVVLARKDEAWDAIAPMLIALEEHHRERFDRLMHACRRLSNSTPEADGFHTLLGDPEQALFDLRLARDRRRTAQGYVTPLDARAFLESARHRVVPLHPGIVDDARGEAGAVLAGPHAQTRLPRLQLQMEFVRDHEPAAYLQRTQELALLANVLVAGCPIRDRPFTPREAFDAATATCNLGLENWPAPLPAGALITVDLPALFGVGWSVLYRDVSMWVAGQLLAVLGDLHCSDREIQVALHGLRQTLSRHWRAGVPWLARDALEAVAMLDLPAWAALVALIAECPVALANVCPSGPARPHAIDPAAFSFVSENTHLVRVRRFMSELPELLSR